MPSPLPADPATVRAAQTAAARDALMTGLDRQGIAVLDMEHVHTAHHAVFRVLTPAGLLLARVGPRTGADRQAFELGLTAALHIHGAPVTVPARGLESNLITTGNHAISLWTWQEHVPAAPAGLSAQIGATLARIHRAGEPVMEERPVNIPVFRPTTLAERRIALIAAEQHREDPALPFVLQRELHKRWAAVRALTPAQAPRGLMHGDFQPSNLLPTARGLIVGDWENACWGRLHWDLTLLEGRCRRGQYPTLSFAEIVAGYVAAGGADPDPDGFETLCRLRDLTSAVWALNEERLQPSGDNRRRATLLLREALGDLYPV